MKNETSGRPDTSVNKNAQNPNGQCHTMAGAVCGTVMPPAAALSHTVSDVIDPCSSLGHRSFEKQG